LNTGLRTKATNYFEKDLYKLMNNAVFGKTCENIEKRLDIRLTACEKSLTKLASKVNYNHHTVKLLGTDTDGLLYYFITKDYYKDTANDVEEFFDTSDYPKDQPAIKNCDFKVGANKKVIGKTKGETSGNEILEFLGLGCKLYSYILNGKSVQKCKRWLNQLRSLSITSTSLFAC
jgi:hypothetical protein